MRADLALIPAAAGALVGALADALCKAVAAVA